ncbi:CAP domain-containing protein [Oscillospiraceae bacterium MB08-C2-2]|nr:CAP domain-containing protein [Oscillospiraceae bacterium MB08-C2-2]
MKIRKLLAIVLCLVLCFTAGGCYSLSGQKLSAPDEPASELPEESASALPPEQEESGSSLFPEPVPLEAESSAEVLSSRVGEPLPQAEAQSQQMEVARTGEEILLAENSTPRTSAPPSQQPLTGEEVLQSLTVQGIEAEMVRLINEERSIRSIAILEPDEKLAQAASIRAAEIFQEFGHTRPDGTAYPTVFDQVGYPYEGRWHGENLSRYTFSPVRFTDAQVAKILYDQFKESPGHYANMVRSDYEYVGVGVSLGIENGSAYSMTVQLFTGAAPADHAGNEV